MDIFGKLLKHLAYDLLKAIVKFVWKSLRSCFTNKTEGHEAEE
jgi:hypothetical protein